MIPTCTKEVPLLFESDEDYFNHPNCWGSTDAKRFHQSPRLAMDHRTGAVPRTDSAAFAFGRAWDARLTAPGIYANKFAVRPEGIDLRTKEGKAWKAECEAKQIQILSADDDHRLWLMEERMPSDLHALVTEGLHQAVLRHPACTSEYAEWYHQAKVDVFYPQQGLMIDIKTTSDSTERFSSNAARYGYHIQAGWYRLAWQLITGEDCDFHFVVTETVSPFRTVLFVPDEQFSAVGMDIARRIHEGITVCHETADWSDKTNPEQTLYLPAWAVE